MNNYRLFFYYKAFIKYQINFLDFIIVNIIKYFYTNSNINNNDNDWKN